MADAVGALVWAAISEENARRAGRCTALHSFREPSAFRNCGKYATCLDKKLTEARRATKKNAKPAEPWSKKNIWGAGAMRFWQLTCFAAAFAASSLCVTVFAKIPADQSNLAAEIGVTEQPPSFFIP